MRARLARIHRLRDAIDPYRRARTLFDLLEMQYKQSDSISYPGRITSCYQHKSKFAYFPDPMCENGVFYLGETRDLHVKVQLAQYENAVLREHVMKLKYDILATSKHRLPSACTGKRELDNLTNNDTQATKLLREYVASVRQQLFEAHNDVTSARLQISAMTKTAAKRSYLNSKHSETELLETHYELYYAANYLLRGAESVDSAAEALLRVKRRKINIYLNYLRAEVVYLETALYDSYHITTCNEARLANARARVQNSVARQLKNQVFAYYLGTELACRLELFEYMRVNIDALAAASEETQRVLANLLYN